MGKRYEKMHPLYYLLGMEILWKDKDNEKVDRIIRGWLTEKSKELRNLMPGMVGAKKDNRASCLIKELLGLLSNSSEDCGPNGCEVKPCSHSSEEPVKFDCPPVSDWREEKPNWKKVLDESHSYPIEPKPPSEKWWCSHMDEMQRALSKGVSITIPQIQTLFGQEIKYCPICGTPRPVKKELWEKLLEYKHPHIAREGSSLVLMPGQAKALADIATRHFKEA